MHKTRQQRQWQHRQRLRTQYGQRGFTLVELLVAMSGALLLSITVFTLAKYATNIYQGETRLANATMANVIGFERLRTDLGRAGMMSSPNVPRDPFVCGSPGAGWPTMLRQMTSVQLSNTPLNSLPAVIANNGLQPQSILISGNLTTDEAYPTAVVKQSGENHLVILQEGRSELVRLGYFDSGADKAAVLATAFPVGRAARITDSAGRYQFGTIQSVSATGKPTVILAGGGPDLVYRDSTALDCGFRIENLKGSINPVNFVRYQIRQLTETEQAAYAPIFDGPGPDYEAARTELIREELDTSGAVIDNTLELITEFAVDLRFGLTVAPSLASPLLYVAPANVANWAGIPGSMPANQGPQLIRTVHATLSVRSRGADRTANIARGTGPMYRMGLGAGGTPPAAPFARVRTTQARVTLVSQLRSNWQ